MLALLGLSSVGGIMSSLAKYWYVLVIAAVVFAIGLFVYSWDQRGRQIDVLNQTNAVLTHNLQDQKAVAAATALNVHILTDQLQQAAARAVAAAAIKGKIAHETPGNCNSAAVRDALGWVRGQSTAK